MSSNFRRVCETILSSPKFTFKEEKVWHHGCDFIYHSVKQMDYRVCVFDYLETNCQSVIFCGTELSTPDLYLQSLKQ